MFICIFEAEVLLIDANVERERSAHQRNHLLCKEKVQNGSGWKICCRKEWEGKKILNLMEVVLTYVCGWKQQDEIISTYHFSFWMQGLKRTGYMWLNQNTILLIQNIWKQSINNYYIFYLHVMFCLRFSTSS